MTDIKDFQVERTFDGRAHATSAPRTGLSEVAGC